MKKLLIDVNSVVPYYVSGRLNGIGRTTLELITALDKIKEDIPFEIALYSQNMKGIGGKNMGLSFKNRHLYFPHREKFDKIVAKYHLREMLYNYNIMHIPHNFDYVARPENCIVTIHDAMFFSYPEEAFNPEFARKYYTDFAKKSKVVITCSESSKKDIINYMQIPDEKIFVTYWGLDRNLFYPRSRQYNKYCGNSPFFISVSCNLGRKNSITIIRAFEVFYRNNPEHHLILVWRDLQQEVINEIEILKSKKNIHILRVISNEELAQLYSDATACFFISLYEGFGLPILESMGTGTPVITCRNSSLEEVGGDAAIYVDPYDIKEISKIMENFENNVYDYEEMKLNSLKQSSKFTWEDCAKRTLEIYKKCMED